ncbi:MAG: thioredoxin domain-containing protein [Parcubacteria group bacterium]|nr:thioredoxin domain-containing protein [Parcubacteria group bacterium]
MMSDHMNDSFSKKSFFIGFGVGIMSMLSVGFFVLLIILLAGNGVSFSKKNLTASVGGQVPSVADQGAPPEITLQDVSKDDHIRGDKSAEIAVVEYSDLECPFCKRFHQSMKDLLVAYPGKVKWVYRHFPLDQLHSKARKEATATECAFDLGGNEKFWEYTDKIFENTPSNNGLDLSLLPQFAKQIGLNEKKFNTCLESDKFADKIQTQVDDAIRAGARGTPYSVIITPDGGKYPLEGALPTEQLKQAVGQFLQ